MSPMPAQLYGVGVDLLRIERMDRAWQRHGQRLCERILHPREAERFAAARRPGNYLAKCFAVKEATVKALGTGFRGVYHRDVGWVPDARGKPLLVFSPRLRALMDEWGVAGGELSLSDEAGMVIAFVVLERSA